MSLSVLLLKVKSVTYIEISDQQFEMYCNLQNRKLIAANEKAVVENFILKSTKLRKSMLLAINKLVGNWFLLEAS